MGHAILDQLFIATNNKDVASFVVVAFIASKEPAISQSFGCFFALIEVFSHHEWRFNDDFADLVRSEEIARLRVDHLIERKVLLFFFINERFKIQYLQFAIRNHFAARSNYVLLKNE